MKRLIINADDFGMTPGVNRAVLQAHHSGVLTSTTLMSTGAASREAIRLAIEGKVGDVGCHVVLLEGAPALEAKEIPSLAVAESDGKSRFRRGFRSFINAALSRGLHAEDIYREAKAQILRLRDSGIEVSHVDTHKHAHVFPSVFRPVLRAAADCGVRAVRNPFEPARSLSWSDVLRRRALWSRYLPVRMLQTFAKEFRRECRDLGLATTQGTLGITLTGFADKESFLTLLNRVPEGTWELICHPAYEDKLWLTLGTRAGSGLRELELLLSPATKHCIRDNGIVLTSYSELYAGARTSTEAASAPVTAINDVTGSNKRTRRALSPAVVPLMKLF